MTLFQCDKMLCNILDQNVVRLDHYRLATTTIRSEEEVYGVLGSVF